MVAIITDKLKGQLVKSMLSEYDNGTNRYFIGLGASEAWDSSDTPPTPTNTEREIRRFRYKAQAIKAVLDSSLVITGSGLFLCFQRIFFAYFSVF